MNKEQANDLLDKFPEFSSVIVKLTELSALNRRKYAELMILNLISSSSEADRDFLSYAERVEHLVNSEISKAPNALAMLASLSRVRYKINKFMDNNVLGLKE